MPLKAVLYTRISVARDSSTSMAGQADDLSALAFAEGWDIVESFADEGVSGGRQRENARRALSMLANGDADVLAVYAYDRWSRMGLEDTAPIVRTLRERREHGRPARFVAIREGIDDDGSDENFDLRLSFAADLAKKERDRTRSRVQKSRARLASAGRFGGGVPPYGYRAADGPSGRTLVVHPDEAAIIREIADRIIADESLVKIASDLTMRKFPRSRSPYRLAAIRLADDSDAAQVKVSRDGARTPAVVTAVLNSEGEPVDAATGEILPRGTWDQARVRDLWLSQHLIGRIVRLGTAPEVVVDADGTKRTVRRRGVPEVISTAFEPIIDLATHQRIAARFTDVRRGHQRKRRASHLLSGLVYCAGCRGRMYPRESGSLYFGCSASARGETCPLGHPRIKAELLERFVTDRFLSYANATPEVRRIESASSDTAARLAEVRALIKETTARLTDRGADRTSVLSSLDELQAQEERLEGLPGEVMIELRPTGRTVGEAWEASADLEARRSLLAAWIDHVSIDRARTRGRTVDTGRIHIEWVPSIEHFDRD
ncbi:DNA invertase Pin-like site-specific DNA recombinase [Microbacterium resistens]|uniref:DNA invertase Pin-like site-specific DNA recombinase n=1 Tax=Microbacterium resistens TaxID=156977 RepID=A0ABU1SB03_9MICO|nr:recombinase family protein [Microbacterium resistens]MDR6866785.1 DNA invertase Pin-like site-specific DNA recombinase [Microbacterium resistens]